MKQLKRALKRELKAARAVPFKRLRKKVRLELRATNDKDFRALFKRALSKLGCAAVADYRAEQIAAHKLKKSANDDGMTLRLVKNPDIIATIAGSANESAAASPRPFMVGFAAETRDLERYARDKLDRKGLDMIVANDVSQAGLGFGVDDNAALVLWRNAAAEPGRIELPAQSKACLAEAVIDRALRGYRATRSGPSTAEVPPAAPQQDPQ